MPFLDPAIEPELDALLAACSDAPSDPSLRLVLADWLEEHDDPRAMLYRLAYEERPIDGWLERHAEEWPGVDAKFWLRVDGGKLVADWKRGSELKGREAIDRGWIDAVATDPHDLVVARTGTPSRLADVRMESYADMRDETIAWLRLLPSLGRVSVAGWNTVSNAAIAMLATIPNIQELELAECPRLTNRAIDVARGFSDLRRLSLARCPRFTRSVGASLAKLTELESLDLACSNWLDDAGANRLASLPRLRTVDVSWCLRLGDGAIEALLESQSLRELAFVGASSATDAVNARSRNSPFDIWSIRAFVEMGSRRKASVDTLVEMAKTGRTSVTRGGFSLLASDPRWESLALGFSQEIDDEIAARLSNLPSLKRLSLAFCHGVESEGLLALAKSGSIEELDLSYLRSVNQTTLAALAETPRLRRLDIRWCENATPEAIAAFQAARPDCRVKWKDESIA